MNPILKYLQETRAELRHVAWPTQTQTIVYTVMVTLLSVGVALYLGLFDFLFTSSLSRALGALPTGSSYDVSQPIQVPTTGTTETGNTATVPSATPAAPLTPIETGPLKFAPGSSDATNNPAPAPAQ